MKRSKHRFLKSVLVVGLLLVLARIVAPYALTAYFNHVLSNLEGYRGHIEDVDLALWRGAYRVEGISFAALSEDGQKYPFFYTKAVDLSIHWKALMEGKVVSEVVVEKPALQLYSHLFTVMAQRPKEPGTAETEDFWSSFYPFELNRFAIVDGTIIYTLTNEEKKQEAELSSIHLELSAITNRPKKDTDLPSPVKLTAQFLETGKLQVDGRANFIGQNLSWDLNGKLTGLALPSLNPILSLYSLVDFNSGVANIYAELKSSGQNISGYIKPVFEGVDLFEWTKDNDSLKELTVEGAAGIFSEVFSNKAERKDQVAAEIPIEGRLEDPGVRGLTAIWSLVRNALFEALKKRFGREATLEDKS